MHRQNATTSKNQPRFGDVAGVRASLLCLLVLALLAGCSNPIGLSSSTIVPEQSAMTYFQWLQSASGDAMQAELRTLSRGNQASTQLRDIKRGL
ncbi:MAG: hypothetical protein V4603_14910, partial [Pseudomonadota bacterium]